MPTRRQFLKSLIPILTLSNLTEASPSTTRSTNSRNLKEDFKKRTLEDLRDLGRKIDDYKEGRKRIIFSYEEWREATEHPESEDASVVKVKARLIDKYPKIAHNHLTKEEEKLYELELKLVEKDLERIGQTEGIDSPRILNSGFRISSNSRLKEELSKTYGQVFDFKNPDQGDKLILYFHRMYGYRKSDGK